MRTSARAVGAIVIFGVAGVSALDAASAAQAVTRSAAVTRYAVGSTNVRSGPAATTSIAGSLAKGTAVTGLQQANGWIKIVTPAKYAGKYVSGAVLAARVPPTPIVFSGWVAADKGGSVNVRSAPRFTAPVTAKYAGGRQVTGRLEGEWLRTATGYLNVGALTKSAPRAVNGAIPLSQLCAIPTLYNSPTVFDPGYSPTRVRYLNCTVLPHLLALEAAYQASTGHRALIDLGYRDAAEQQYWIDLYTSGLGNPASPVGSSNHGWGLAVDFMETARFRSEFAYGAPGHRWLLAHARAFGFAANPIADPANGESYHWNFVPEFPRSRASLLA